MKKWKRVLATTMSLAMVFSLNTVAFGADSDMTVIVDGVDVSADFTDSEAWAVEGDSIMVGLRALAESMGADVSWDKETRVATIDGLATETGVFSPVAYYEYLVGGAAWQMSAEAHALIMQGFNLATKNVDAMIAEAESATDTSGYYYEGEKLMFDGEQVAIISDVDDTLVDGVHYTANILGLAGEWTNKAFADFVMSEGCTALPGAVDFVNYCVDSGIEVFYVTNRYDQGYKLSESQYGGEEGYTYADGTVIGSSTYEMTGQTFYDITMDSMEKLGFPTQDETNENYSADAYLIVNDTKLKGSSKEVIREVIADGGEWATGERVAESTEYPEYYDLDGHHVAMILGDDLNDISQIFSDSGVDAVSREEIAMENMDKWGAEWIVFPNAVYGSSMNYAGAYGILDLFRYFDYTNEDTDAWEIYE